MGDYIGVIATSLGIPVWTLIIFFLWSITWKLIAMWKSARKGSLVWFIILAVVNTMGILEILYIFVFSKIKCCEPKRPARKKIAKRKGRR